jgi:hypothetical protein
MQAVASQSFQATLLAPADVVGLGARIEQPVTRAIVAAFVAGTKDPVTGVWSVTLDAPATAGDYQLVWRTSDPEPPDYEVFVPLVVVGAGSGGAGGWTPWPPPDVDQVAELLRARTNVMGTEHGTFDDDTRPTGEQVQAIITTAVGDVAARVGAEIPADYHADATRLAALRAAALIEASVFPDQLDTDRSAHRQYTAMYLSGVQALAAAIPHAMRLA